MRLSPRTFAPVILLCLLPACGGSPTTPSTPREIVDEAAMGLPKDYMLLDVTTGAPNGMKMRIESLRMDTRQTNAGQRRVYTVSGSAYMPWADVLFPNFPSSGSFQVKLGQGCQSTPAGVIGGPNGGVLPETTSSFTSPEIWMLEKLRLDEFEGLFSFSGDQLGRQTWKRFSASRSYTRLCNVRASDISGGSLLHAALRHGLESHIW